MSLCYRLPEPDHKDHVPDIRQLPFDERRALAFGAAVHLFDGDTCIMQLPRKLFLAATANPSLIDHRSEIHLPPNTGREAILRICFHLLELTTSAAIIKLRGRNGFEADLRLLQAARLLYMEPYVSHIQSLYWWRFRNQPINAADVEIVLSVALECEDPLVSLIGKKIAAIIHDGVADELEKLKAYVAGQPYLNYIVARGEEKITAVLGNQTKPTKLRGPPVARNSRRARRSYHRCLQAGRFM